MRTTVITFLLVTTTLVSLCHGKEVGASCVLDHNGAAGVCKLPEFCPKVIQDFKQKKIAPTGCGWTQTSQIVCCENQVAPTTATTPSAAYCQQYQQYVYESVKISSLAVGDTVQTRRVDRCAHKKVPLIVGGTAAIPREFPHMALIGYGDLEIEWACGGSLISDKWVLTAGHCSQTRLGPAKKVRLGEYDKTKTTDDARVEDFKITKNIAHPNYKSSSTYNDIALLELDHAARLSIYVRPICLPQLKQPLEKRAIASGWGRIEFQGEKSDKLLKVTLEIFPQSECTKVYGTQLRWKDGLKEDLQICAGSRTNIQDTCEGDSGGPLQVYHPDQYCMYVIVGVTSFGKGCGLAGTPAVYTRVHTFVPWIESIVWPK